MGIVTSLNPAKYIETVEQIIFEWLTDTSCFNTGSSATAEVYPYMKQDTERDDMIDPWVEFMVHVRNTQSTGGGALNREARWRHITVEMLIIAKRPQTQLDLVKLSDTLDAYFRHATKGFSALGGAGLKNARLVGPVQDHTQLYYVHKWFLDARFLAANAV